MERRRPLRSLTLPAHQNPLEFSMRVWAYMLGGWGFLGIGILGIFLPILPTTPFLLLSSYCFVRSSPRCHRWLMKHRIFGRYVRDWDEKRGVRRGVKTTAFAMMIGVTIATTAFAELPLWALGVLYALVATGMVVVWRLPTVTDEPAPLEEAATP